MGTLHWLSPISCFPEDVEVVHGVLLVQSGKGDIWNSLHEYNVVKEILENGWGLTGSVNTALELMLIEARQLS